MNTENKNMLAKVPEVTLIFWIIKIICCHNIVVSMISDRPAGAAKIASAPASALEFPQAARLYQNGLFLRSE